MSCLQLGAMNVLLAVLASKQAQAEIIIFMNKPSGKWSSCFVVNCGEIVIHYLSNANLNTRGSRDANRAYVRGSIRAISKRNTHQWDSSLWFCGRSKGSVKPQLPPSWTCANVNKRCCTSLCDSRRTFAVASILCFQFPKRRETESWKAVGTNIQAAVKWDHVVCTIYALQNMQRWEMLLVETFVGIIL